MGELDRLFFKDESGLPPNWTENANCRDLTPDSFFSVNSKTCKIAKAICAECIIIDDCLHYALSNNIQVGIYAETTPRERRIIRLNKLKDSNNEQKRTIKSN